MDASTLPTTNADWAEHVAAAISRQRERVREFLAAQQERLQGAEIALAAHLQELDAQRSELRQRQESAAAAEKQLAEERRALEAARVQAVAESERAATSRAQADAQRAELAALAERLAAREAETAAQRRRIARELKARRKADLEELERRRAELPSLDAVGDFHVLQQALDAAHRREKDLAAEVESLRAENGQIAAAKRREEELAAEVESLRAECERLSQTIAQAASAPPAAAGDAEDYRRRYEMSLEDLRDLKSRNAELQQQLAAAKAAGPSAAPQKGGVLSWEAEKQRILAALESDSGEKPTKEERLKVDEVIHRTDQLLADKEREIEELKKVLGHQSDNLGAVAVGAAALGEMLDKDAIVQEERQSLKRMQDEWREKLRQAEIDISMERAKIARERAQVEERLRALESQAASAAEKPDAADKEGTPVRGRWLARLGLKEGNEGGKK